MEIIFEEINIPIFRYLVFEDSTLNRLIPRQLRTSMDKAKFFHLFRKLLVSLSVQIFALLNYLSPKEVSVVNMYKFALL